MPTGYTADVQSGKVTEFKDFALQCARAFGALITMRDDPAGAEIPDEFAPSPYYANALAEAKDSLAALDLMSDDVIAMKTQEHNESTLASYRNRLAEKAEHRTRYQSMIDKVEAWQPPTEDHQPMKKFMIEQLTGSIDHDCSTKYMDEPKQLTPTEWLNEQRESLTREVEYYTKNHAEEVERCASRTAWIKALRASLDGEVK